MSIALTRQSRSHKCGGFTPAPAFCTAASLFAEAARERMGLGEREEKGGEEQDSDMKRGKKKKKKKKKKIYNTMAHEVKDFFKMERIDKD